MDKLKYKIGEKEYSDSKQIKTTLFLERCRIMHFASDILWAYINDQKFKKQIDERMNGVNYYMASMVTIPTALDNILTEWLSQGWITPHELGENTL